MPTQCAAIDDSELQAVIDQVYQKAKAYGFNTRAQYKRYLNLMFTFGRDFDTDPQLPWASEVLGNRSVTNAEQRMHILYGVARRHQFAGGAA